MSTIASTFVSIYNYNLGQRTVEDLLTDPSFSNLIQKTEPYARNSSNLLITFKDGSLAKITQSEEATEPLSYQAKPFVKVGIGKAVVYANSCNEIFIQVGGKKLRISVSETEEVVTISGMGELKKYNGFEVEFK